MISDNLAPIQYEDIVVAWKDTREARRAVVDAKLFLTRAQNVLVVMIAEHEPKAGKRKRSRRRALSHEAWVKVRSEVVDASSSQASWHPRSGQTLSWRVAMATAGCANGLLAA